MDSKIKSPVFSFEVSIKNLKLTEPKHIKTSEFPASYRDLSFSLSNHENLEDLAKIVKKFSKTNDLMTDAFIFDLFENKKQEILKVGYRFKFQSVKKSLTDEEIEDVISSLIEESLSMNGISIEGL